MKLSRAESILNFFNRRVLWVMGVSEGFARSMCNASDPRRGGVNAAAGGTGTGSPNPSGGSVDETPPFIRAENSGVAPANQTKERSAHELFTGAFRNKSSM